jgi:hypothetical protein
MLKWAAEVWGMQGRWLVLAAVIALSVSVFCGGQWLVSASPAHLFPEAAFPAPPPDPFGAVDLGGGEDVLFPVSLQDLPGADEAVPYDDGVTWSWEEEVEPIDIYDFIESMPFNWWQVIDEKTCRALFEDLIQKVVNRWNQPSDGRLAQALREYIFKFTPEYEYWYPVYEPDPEKREVKWPVKIAKVMDKNGNPGVYFKLGRPDDEFRYILIGFNKQQDGTYLIYPIIKESYKWTAERSDIPKTVTYSLIRDPRDKNNKVCIVKKNVL